MAEQEQAQTQNEFDINPLGFASKIDYGTMYNIFYAKLSELQFQGQADLARDFFNLSLGNFAILFDELFILNCIEIETEYKNDPNTIFMLQLSELSTLIMRAGIAPRPDIELVYDARWDVPRSLDELSLDGKTRLGKGVLADVYSQDQANIP